MIKNEDREIERKEEGKRKFGASWRYKTKTGEKKTKSIKCDAQLDHYTPDQNDCSKLIDIVLKK